MGKEKVSPFHETVYTQHVM